MKLLISFFLLTASTCFADIKSTNGTINFDTQMDNQSEMVLNSVGLGIGVSPSTNLHINGNAIVSEQLFVGGSNGSSNLNVNGTVGFSYQTVSSNATLDDQTVVFVDSSSDNIILTLPYAGNVSGKIFLIKKVSLNNIVQLNSSGNLIDSSEYYTLSSGNLSSLMLLSNGSNWYILEKTNGATAPWSPTEVVTTAWFDASDASTVIAGASSNVYQWNDKSGNDNHATQSTGAAQPTTGASQINNLNVIDWTKNVTSMVTNDIITGTEDSVFMVISRDSNPAFDVILGSTSSNYFGWAGSLTKTYQSQQAFYVDTTAGILMLSTTRNSTSSDIRLNGTALTEVSNGIAGVTTPAINGIGGFSTFGLQGSIAEIIIMPTAVSSTVRLRMEGYLAHKWNLTANLPANHPYKILPP